MSETRAPYHVRPTRQAAPPMSLQQALALALLVVDFELETATAREWVSELKLARQVLADQLDRQPVEPFFLSATERRRRVSA